MPSTAVTSICVVAPYEPTVSETFIRAHAQQLPAKTLLIHGWRPHIGSRPILSFPQLVLHKLRRTLFNEDLSVEVTRAYKQAFKRNRIAAVLAEYGETGVQVLDACREMKVPLIVHFHGYDASVKSVLEEYRAGYLRMFREAVAIIAVSRAMERRLVSLGALPEKVHYNPYGIDCSQFIGARPAEVPPVFLAVGRFVEKKAPQLTIQAFNQVREVSGEAKLRMIGDGKLLSECRELVQRLGVSESVTFLGAQPPEVVQSEMRTARCFVQHSVEAASGDCEGTPVGILEAGASGLPVVSTLHGGIPDVVLEGETGFLVAEHDVDNMAERMMRLVREPELADRMGLAARRRIEANFTMEQSLSRLWDVISGSIKQRHSDA